MTAGAAADQAAILADGCEHVETRAELETRLAAGERLTVKLGIDPTGRSCTSATRSCLRKMQQFVEFGHRVVLLIGDLTARIGDPSGRNETRPPLTDEQIAAEHARLSRTSRQGPRPRTHRGDVQLQLARAAHVRRSDRADVRKRPSRKCSTRNDFANRYADGYADRAARVPLSHRASIRQRGDARPASNSAGPTSSSIC